MVAVAVLGLASTGAVAQGVSFSGSGNLGVVYNGDTKDEDGNVTKEAYFQWISNFDLGMSASGTTDGGLTFGAGAKIKAGNGGDGSRGHDSTVGAANAYIAGESWKIAIGDLDPASDKGKTLGDVGFDGDLGVDNVAESINTEGQDGQQGTDADVEVTFSLGAASLAITAGTTPGKARDGGTKATKQDSEWAAGVGFEIGSTNLGIGMDSEKLMQATIGADLGAFGGKLFFSQQKADGPKDMDTDAGTAGNQVGYLTNKKTGIGVEVSVSAGANTMIKAVYARGKQSDVRTMYDYSTGANDEDNQTDLGMHQADTEARTDKGFGVGVTHILGGGATLEAGFAKVKKQTKASVGVSMSF